jgi:hypothetical protein
VHYKRKLVQGLVGVLVGAGLVAGGVVTHHIYLEAAGAAIALLSLLWVVICWRRHAARVRPARVKAKQAKSVGPSASGHAALTRRARMMERMEERWRRRQEGNQRRM